jgi:hypothetical protein
MIAAIYAPRRGRSVAMSDQEERIKSTEDRWRAARARLAAAAETEGLTGRIVSVMDWDFTAQFTRGGATWTMPAYRDIAMLEDDPSPNLDSLIERAKQELP